MPAMLWPLIAQGAGLVARTFSKPDINDYKPDLSAIRRMEAYLRGKRSNREVYQTMLRPQLRTIGQQQNRALEQTRNIFSRQGMQGTGAEAQATQNVISTGTQQMQSVGEQASAAQLQENQRIEENLFGLENQAMQLQNQAKQNYQIAKNQWQQGMIGDVIGLAGNVAMTLGQQHQALKSTYESAKASGLLPDDTSFTKFKKSMGTSGYSEPEAYYQALQRERGVENADAIIGATYGQDVLTAINSNPALKNLGGEQKMALVDVMLQKQQGVITEPYAKALTGYIKGASSTQIGGMLTDYLGSDKPKADDIKQMFSLYTSRRKEEASQQQPEVDPKKTAEAERALTRVYNELMYPLTVTGDDGEQYLDFSKTDKPEKAKAAFNRVQGLLASGLTIDSQEYSDLQKNLRSFYDNLKIDLPPDNIFDFHGFSVQIEVPENLKGDELHNYRLNAAREKIYEHHMDMIDRALKVGEVTGEASYSGDDAELLNKYLNR